MNRHLLTVGDLDAAEIVALLDLASALKRDSGGWRRFDGEILACIFEKPSTRTRASVAAAAARLGLTALFLRPDELQLARGETIADTARTLGAYASAIVARTFEQRNVDELAAASAVPVVNALSNEHHPLQALADVLTLRERFGRLEGLRVAYVGNPNNVARSLVEAGALLGVEVVVATAPALAAHAPGAVVTDPRAAVAGAHAVYTDAWTSMGEEADREARRLELADYRVDARLLAAARDDAVFLHCLPANRGVEVAAEVIDGPQSLVWQQAANRLVTTQAVLWTLLTRDV